MEDYAGRVLADRYRLPLPPEDAYEVAETRAFDTYSGQEVLVRQVPLPEVVEAEMVGPDGGAVAHAGGAAQRGPADPAVRRAIDAAQNAAQVPDHPRLDQVFDVFSEAGSLWIVSELVAARPLSALLAERPLTPYRAAEIASDVLTAVRVLHGHGWVHRNITARTVLVCDDGRVVLTGLAAGAAEEALCGYDPVPEPPGQGSFADPGAAPSAVPHQEREQAPGREVPEARERSAFAPPPPAAPGYELPGTPYASPESYAGPYGPGQAEPRAAEGGPSTAGVPAPQGHAAFGGQSPYGASSGTSGALPRPPRQQSTPGVPAPYGGPNAQPALPSANSASEAVRAARAGAIAAYRAGARAAARVSDDERSGQHAVPGGAAGEQRQPAAERREAPPQDRPWQPEQPRYGEQPATPQDGLGAPDPRTPQDTQDADAGGTGGAQAAPGTQGAQGAQGADPGRPAPQAPAPDWWSTPPSGFGDPEADTDDDEPPSPYRPRLAGTWRDGPEPWNDAAGGVPAGGGGDRPRGRTPALPAGYTPAHGGREDALRADARRAGEGGDPRYAPQAQRPAPLVPAADAGSRWDAPVPVGAAAARYGGPATPLAAERARQARIAVVGAVTERWSPEQAGPVHENWQLAAPIGPATDLWALGALLYRAVQGHAPYPEDSAAELVQLVCSEPPAFAEECGPLRPVVESLLRQDPTERPDFEELRGWLRSLVRSAPEPDAGQDLVSVPTEDGRLPIKRRKGELVRKRRRFGRKAGAGRETGGHGHRRGKGRQQRGGAYAYAEQPPLRERPPDLPLPPGEGAAAPSWAADGARDTAYGAAYDTSDGGDLGAELFGRGGETPSAPRRNRAPKRSSGGRAPRSLGRTLLVLILLLLVGAIVYAMVFLPKSGEDRGQSVREAPTSAPAAAGGRSAAPPASPSPGGDAGGAGGGATDAPTLAAGSGTHLAKGYVLRKDPEGFQVAVRKDWQRHPVNDSGQVRYTSGDFTLIVVPGRDTVQADGSDPLVYQSDKEPELQPFRSSTWASASGLRRIDVGQQAMAEGQYTWQDANGRTVYVRNLAMIIGGRYHVVQVIGPDSQRDEVSGIYQQATASYKVLG
ncbi:protein kinase [Streptomyces sp. NPDC047002]|uniref:protein kinase n=1 Tax=Streptomyces sp. NPDC047002 TaxID=3155475 RepID=UPI003455925D